MEAGHYHQGRLGQTFWKRLMTARVIPAGTRSETADDALVAAGHGITDLIKLPTPRDEATDAVLTAGVGPLWQKIAIWRPAAVVFVYKRGATICAGRALPETWGPSARGGPGGPAVLPDARPVRAGRTGGRGPELPAQSRLGVAGGSGLAPGGRLASSSQRCRRRLPGPADPATNARSSSTLPAA